MKLEPGERSILATFPNRPDAEAAMSDLKAAGFDTVQLDRVGEFGFRPDTLEQRPAISGEESSLVQAVLKPSQMDANSAILLAATPEASGMSAPNQIDHMPFLMTIVTNDSRVEEAVALLKERGAQV
jgi:hypothetical protein